MILYRNSTYAKVKYILITWNKKEILPYIAPTD